MKPLYTKQPFPVVGWEREEHFHFFRQFTQPFFNVSTEIDITALYSHCKRENLSVFLAYLHTTITAARATENFLLRLDGEGIVKYDAVDISSTILKPNNTISFVHLPHHHDLHTFCASATEVIAKAKASPKLLYGYNGPDLLHSTTLPWFKLSSMEHAYTVNPQDSVPKLAFGKIEKYAGKVILPISISLHHALADGYHVHLFLENYKNLMNTLPQ